MLAFSDVKSEIAVERLVLDALDDSVRRLIDIAPRRFDSGEIRNRV